MPKILKPLVITTRTVQAAGSEYVWNKLQNPTVFISNIVTPEVNIENVEELNKLISGIPTPFARQAMFKYAINYVEQASTELTGLMSFYKTLQNEWKGLIACIALDNQPLSVEKVELSYSDGKEIGRTDNMYEVKGALGNMLFEDRNLWCDQEQIKHEEGAKNAKPYIYVIRYNSTVIGGTSPESLLFTAPAYRIDCRKSFYSKSSNTFTDPLKADLRAEEVEKLYVYVKHVSNSIDNYEDSFAALKPKVSRVSIFLSNWLTEIREYARKKGFNIDENAIVPNFNKFKAPFDLLFNFQTRLYGYGGRINADRAALNAPDEDATVEVELAELLLDPDTGTVSEIVFNNAGTAASSGVHMLKAASEWGDRYFTLPLSEKGLVIFQDEIEGLLQTGGAIKSNLSAIYDIASNTLRVTLQVDVNGNTTSFERNYRDPIRIEGQKVICWPDFISKKWDKYYLYSELPHNAPELKAYPLRADIERFRLLSTIKDGVYKFNKIAENGKKVDEADNVQILIEYDINRHGSKAFKYEIYESAQPFKGIELQFKDRPSGYLVFKSTSDKNSLTNLLSEKMHPNPVRVGFDFGSNNTCISYADIGGQPQLITFKNRRRFLLGVDDAKDSRVAAMQNKVFFFQHEETKSNQIKSMVMIHDENRVKDIQQDIVVNLSKEIKGGFPVFEKNIPVEASEETTHKVSFNNQLSSIKYNMKWSNIPQENAYKQGLLKTLWLKTYAELFDLEKFPESLVWAYPSSMNTQIINKYRIMWAEIGQLNPLHGFPNAIVAVPDNTQSRASKIKPAKKSTDDSWGDAGTSDGWGNGGSNDSWGSSNDGWDKSTDNALRGNDDVLRAQTEAESVCRHALGVGLNPGTRGLMMGFDVGGSTTDILCVALKKNAEAAPVNTLIKQSSIKFAAGKLADATKRSKKFKEVLTSFCIKKGYQIHGVNIEPIRLNSSTSSFYYNMIVDRLDTPEALNEFYMNISAHCPELFIINAYMTGLIMFYAGQLAYKIKTTSQGNPEYHPDFFEEIRIGIFGKGGRMFDWLKAISEQTATGYYKECFGLGYGPKVKDDITKWGIKWADPQYVKAEVSFGLSRRDPLNTSGNRISELIGEEGYTYNGQPVNSLDDVEFKFLRDFGTQLSYPREFKQFSGFVKKFAAFAKEHFGFSLPNIQQEINDMEIVSYVTNIPEFILARDAGSRDADEFDFESPIIILEGMCFLDKVLLEKVFK